MENLHCGDRDKDLDGDGMGRIGYLHKDEDRDGVFIMFLAGANCGEQHQVLINLDI